MTNARCATNITLLVTLALLGVGAAAAQDYKPNRSWAASCATCHGTSGESAGYIPPLAGRSKSDLFGVLKEFKGGKRKAATVMHQYALGYTDAQLESIAEYFSHQPR